MTEHHDRGIASQGALQPSNRSDIVEFLRTASAEYYGVIWRSERGRSCYGLANRIVVRPADATADPGNAAIELHLACDDADRDCVRTDSESIERLAAYDRLPAWVLEPTADTPLHRASQQRRLARVAPQRISIPTLLDLIETGDDAVQQTCLDAVRRVIESTDSTDQISSLIPIVGQRATDAADPRVRTAALDALTAFASERPADIEPLLPDLVGVVDEDHPRRTLSGLQCLTAIAEQDPSECVSSLPEIAWCLHSDSFLIRHQCIVLLSEIAPEHPDAVRPYTEDIVSDCLPGEYPSEHVCAALSIVGHVSREYPDAIVDSTSRLVELVDNPRASIRTNATGVLSSIAHRYSTELMDYSSRFVDLLFDDEPAVRRNASLVVSSLAEDFPEQIEEYLPEIVATLDDPEPIVRENACWTLGHLQSPTVRDLLLERRRHESDAAVLDALGWALTELDTK